MRDEYAKLILQELGLVLRDWDETGDNVITFPFLFLFMSLMKALHGTRSSPECQSWVSLFAPASLFFPSSSASL